MNYQTKKSGHTMSRVHLATYCDARIHSIIKKLDVKKVKIIPQYNRTATISDTEKNDKMFNFKHPTVAIEGTVALLYVFPGVDYVSHYAKIYRAAGYDVEVTLPTVEESRRSVEETIPKDLPEFADVIILGYVEPLAGNSDWHDSEDMAWSQTTIEGCSVVFIGVKYSYWGNLMYYVANGLANRTDRIIYVGKLGSLCKEDVPNMTIATGDSSVVEGETITWKNLFAKSPIVVSGKHVTLPSVLDETKEWFLDNQSTYRFVDPEIGWAAKACHDNKISFSYLHLVTDNLCGDFSDNLTNERSEKVIEKRLQYVGIMKAIIWHAIAGDKNLIYPAIMHAQQKRVDRGLMKPLKRDWAACLSFSYHTQEEAWEVVRELPRREWKDQVVNPERVLSEMADTQIQLLTALTYAGFDEVDLKDAVMEKLGAKRPDWK